ncbi:hypothetical protein D3C79_776340 [compost metagenome]
MRPVNLVSRWEAMLCASKSLLSTSAQSWRPPTVRIQLSSLIWSCTYSPVWRRVLSQRVSSTGVTLLVG